VGKTIIEVGECAIELSLEAFFEDWTEAGTGLHPALDEVSSKNNRLGCGVLHSKFFGSVKQPFSFGEFR
jgi:hypothetical protein